MSRFITFKSSRASGRGSAIVLVLVFTTVCLIVLAAALEWSMTNTNLNYRYCQSTRSTAAAEAATEKVLSALATDYRNLGEGYVLTNIAYYRGLYPTPSESSTWADYTFMDVQGTTNSTYVQYAPASIYKVVSEQYNGLRGFANAFQVISNVRQTGSTASTVVSAVEQDLQLSTVPVFQFAMFYNMDLEFDETQIMNVTGPVYCNATMYLSPGNTLTFKSDVMAAGSILNTFKLGNVAHSSGGAVVYLGAHDAGVSTLNLPIGTNNSVAAVRQVVEVPPTGEAATSSMGKQRLYNKADLIILVTNNAVVLKSGLVNNFATNVPWLQATQFLRTNISFFNQREAKTIKATEIDIAQLILWNATNTLLRPVIATHDIRIIYVADQRTLAVTNEAGIRLINGQTLLPQGLTVVTPNPLYVKGNYNCPTSALGTTNTSGTLPASFAADAITILSANWNDANGAASYTTRPATNTTINAAFLTGIVETTVATGASGGVENLPRLLEDWSSKTLTYNGSMVVMFDSLYAIGNFDGVTTYYAPPVRNWAFDQNYLDPTKFPPGTPAAYILIRGNWRVAQPNSTNSVVTL